jgi:hypothetical protein
MSRYVLLYSAPLAVSERFATASPEEAQLGLQAWVEWAEKLGPTLVDPGKPLGNGRTITSNGVSPSDTQVIGMSIIEADSMDHALSMVEDHHHLAWADGTAITVLEEMGIPELDQRIV